jgi:hypothetical protein
MNLPSELTGLHFSRRDMLRTGALATAGLLLGKRPGLAALSTSIQPPIPQKAKAVIQVWLWGGAAHLDTFDPKPDAGYDYCGPYNKPIKTSTDGLMINQLLTQLATQADKYSIIRGMTHGSFSHETAAYMVQTGHDSNDRLVYPSIGAVVSLFKGYDAGYNGLVPPYVVLTELQGRFSECGFLGPRYQPFATGGDPSRKPFAVQGIVQESISTRRQRERRNLLQKLDTFGSAMSGDPNITEYNHCGEEAYDMILGDGGKIFDLAEEKDQLRDTYGRNSFGQSCLVARRLVEHGVRFITINYKGWDTHKENFVTLDRKLPELDKGLAALIQDLSQRGLLDSTIVWCSGEFGRQPKIDWQSPWNGGRNHWGKVFSALVAGGGFKGGHVVGASDAKGEEVKDRPVYPWDLTATMDQLLGIDPDSTFPHIGDSAIKLTQVVANGIKSGGRLKEIV